MLLFFINLISSASANAFLIILTVLKVIFFSIIGVMGDANITSYKMHFGPPTDMLKAASMAIFAFLGVEFAAASRSVIKNPEKNVMRATKLGLFFATMVFLGVHCAVLFTLPDPASSTKPVYDTAAILFANNKFIAAAFGIIAVMSCLSTLNGMLTVQSSNVKGISDKSWWPKSLGSSNKEGFSWKGALLFCLIVFSLLYSNAADPNILITIANSLIALMYFASCAVDIKQFGFNLYNILAILSSVLILYNLNFQVFIWMLCVYIFGYSLKIISIKRSKNENMRCFRKHIPIWQQCQPC
jgi:amino acid transporter